MILGRPGKALKNQNWLAAFVEFAIVIAGIVIGFQVNAWNEHRVASERLSIQLMATAEEMRANLSAIEARHARMTAIIDEINLARGWFADPDAAQDVDLGELVSIFGVSSLSLETDALDELERMPAFRRTADAATKPAITAWRTSLILVERLEQDSVSHRDLHAMPWLIDYPGFADLVAQSGFHEARFPPPRVEAKLQDLVEDPRFEGLLVSRYLLARSQANNLSNLHKRTETVIERLSQSGSETRP